MKIVSSNINPHFIPHFELNAFYYINCITLSKEVINKEQNIRILRKRNTIPIITRKGVSKISILSAIDSDSIILLILFNLFSTFLIKKKITFHFLSISSFQISPFGLNFLFFLAVHKAI